MKKSTPYRLISKIGKGGMAQVYKAVKTGPDGFEKTIALKKILPQYTDHPELIQMLSLEAKIHSTLNHANIVQLYDFFQYQNQYMIAMEFVDGKNAKELIYQCKERDITLPWQASVMIIIEVLKALDYAHHKKNEMGSLHIVHRDISPHNILISYDGSVKLTDFGIANAQIKDYKTKSGVLKGKYRYLSPEQVTHEEITPQTDLFSCGVTLYEMLTFVHPFDQKSEFELFKSIVRAEFIPATSISDIPEFMDDLIDKALEPEMIYRFTSARDFLHALTKVQDHQWLLHGQEKMAHLMDELFNADQRALIPIEPTKILQKSDAISQLPANLEAPFWKALKKRRFLQKKWIVPAVIIGFFILLLSWSLNHWMLRPPPQPIKTAQQEPATGFLMLDGPPKTQVYINGKRVGVLPLKNMQLKTDTYLVVLRNKHQQTLQKVNIQSGKTHHVSLD